MTLCVVLCMYVDLLLPQCTYPIRIPYVSHLFEIQTASRTYLCGASTHEEMQSWVGILQTLTQYCGQHEIVGVCPGKGSDNEDGKDLLNIAFY